MEATAICTKCGEERPLDQFEWRKEKGTYRRVCNPCLYARRRQREQADPDLLARARARTREWKEEQHTYPILLAKEQRTTMTLQQFRFLYRIQTGLVTPQEYTQGATSVIARACSRHGWSENPSPVPSIEGLHVTEKGQAAMREAFPEFFADS
jgi:hypothetical protein